MQQLGVADDLDEHSPELRCAAVDDAVAVLRVIAAAGRRGGVAVAVLGGHLAGSQVHLEHGRRRDHAAVRQRNVDELTHAGLFALTERGQNADRQVQAADDVTKGRTAANGVVLRPTGDAHYAGPCLRHRVVARTVSVRAGRAEAGDAAVDQAGVDLLELFIAKAELFHRAGAEILHQHVHGLD